MSENPGVTTLRDPGRRIELLAGLCLYAVLAAAWLALAPGLGGEFIFDDSWNLRGLEKIQDHPGWRAMLDYAVNGISSPLGRPLALLTFELHYASWPTDARDFLYFNVLLHLATGALLCWALIRLARLAGVPENRALGLAVAAAALWTLAPLQASAVLYIVQRMALLAGTCTFAGLILYLGGRERLAHGDSASGLLWMTMGLGVGAGVGTLAKESAALFPLCILVVEFTLLRTVPRERMWPWWGGVFLVAPVMLLLAYLAIHIPNYLPNPHGRPFSFSERLLTEPRVLFMYLGKLLFPSLYSIRLLYDDLIVSRGLFSPLTTLWSILGWSALAGLAVFLRKSAPVFAFGVLWYLGCHVLESTVVPLELAFEHRNYVASVGPVVALVWYAARLLGAPAARRVRWPLAAAAGLYVAFQWTALWQSATLWGQPLEQMRWWAQQQPDSRRAQYQVADAYLWNDQGGAAVAVLERAMEKWTGDPTPVIALMEIGCIVPEGPAPSLARFFETTRRFHGHVLSTVNMLDRLLKLAEAGHCDRYSPAQLFAMVEMVAEVPQFRRQKRNLMVMRSRIAELANDREAARDYLDQAIRMSPVMGILAQGTFWALQAGDLDKAREYVAKARKRERNRNPLRRVNNRLIADRLETVLQEYTQATQDSPKGEGQPPEPKMRHPDGRDPR